MNPTIWGHRPRVSKSCSYIKWICRGSVKGFDKGSIGDPSGFRALAEELERGGGRILI